MLVLNFHRVESFTGFEITRLSPARFRMLMDILADSRLRVAPLGAEPLASSSDVLITFDDGFASIAEHALPLVHERGWGAIVFLVADAVGTHDDWDVRLLGRRRPMMSWEEARRWSEVGIEFGSHSLTHADLTALSERQMAQGAGYDAAFATDASIEDGVDRYAIPRVNVHNLMSTFQYRSLLRAASPAQGRRDRWFGQGRSRLYTSLSAGSAVVGNWRRQSHEVGGAHPTRVEV
ncbi:MAG: polysaccharide deacetylase family protein [candidate division Zixibacteria bacterium]|nr:polysaccharide deacetylase family protein [candidate division Zixibacteria bacterium]